MGLLIKGIKIPRSCGFCMFDDYGYCIMAKQYSGGTATHGRASFCPLAELPEKHGRLIDADTLLTKTINNPLHVPYIVEKDIQDMPTIVEAEGEEEENDTV